MSWCLNTDDLKEPLIYVSIEAAYRYALDTGCSSFELHEVEKVEPWEHVGGHFFHMLEVVESRMEDVGNIIRHGKELLLVNNSEYAQQELDSLLKAWAVKWLCSNAYVRVGPVLKVTLKTPEYQVPSEVDPEELALSRQVLAREGTKSYLDWLETGQPDVGVGK